MADPVEDRAKGLLALAQQINQSQGLLHQIDPLAHSGAAPSAQGLLSAYQPTNTLGNMSEPLYHGSPTYRPGMPYDVNRSSIAPRTDKGYLGKAVYLTPQKWIAESYAKPPKGGTPGTVSQADIKPGKMLDVTYDENYIANLEKAAQSLGIDDKFMSPGWADNFAAAAQKAGYIGARGLNSDGTPAEIAIYDPSHVSFK